MTPTQPKQPSKHLDNLIVHGECDSHCENEGTGLETLNCSNKHSIAKDDLQGAPLMKEESLMCTLTFSLE